MSLEVTFARVMVIGVFAWSLPVLSPHTAEGGGEDKKPTITITKVDAKAGTITIRNDATRKTQTVAVPKHLLSSVRVGEVIQPQSPPPGAVSQPATSGEPTLIRCRKAGGTLAQCYYWIVVLGGK